jgi:hypothetical protein
MGILGAYLGESKAEAVKGEERTESSSAIRDKKRRILVPCMQFGYLWALGSRANELCMMIRHVYSATN